MVFFLYSTSSSQFPSHMLISVSVSHSFPGRDHVLSKTDCTTGCGLSTNVDIRKLAILLFINTHINLPFFVFSPPGKVLFCLQLVALFPHVCFFCQKTIKLTKMIQADNRNRRKIVASGNNVTFILNTSDQCPMLFTLLP